MVCVIVLNSIYKYMLSKNCNNKTNIKGLLWSFPVEDSIFAWQVRRHTLVCVALQSKLFNMHHGLQSKTNLVFVLIL